ncbi:MAG: permease [Bacteroidetes bacterium]|nr:permease [Bacteroidota bacterium]
MKKLMKKYRLFFAITAAIIIITIINVDFGKEALSVSFYSLKEILSVIPPIFILLGLLDVWVPRETMVKYMGENSSVKGIVIAFIIGSAAAGPLYGAFPAAAVFLRKGASFRNVFIFIGAWSTTKIPMFLFEYSALGPRFAVTRLLVDIPGIIIIAVLLSRLLSQRDKEKILENLPG